MNSFSIITATTVASTVRDRAAAAWVYKQNIIHMFTYIVLYKYGARRTYDVYVGTHIRDRIRSAIKSVTIRRSRGTRGRSGTRDI